MKIKNAESGRSMIEMLGVMAIMIVIGIAAVEGWNLLNQSLKRSNVQDDVVKMVSGVRGLLGGYDDFSGIDANTIFAAIGVSNKNPYGGKYELSANPADKKQFVVSITGLNVSDCEYFRTRAWPDSAIFRASNRKLGGAAAVPANCGDQSGKNTVRIIYGE